MLEFELAGGSVLIAKYQNAGPRAKDEIVKEVTGLTLKLEAHIKKDKLSGQVLNVVSGDLRASVHSILPVEQSGGTVRGHVAQSGDVKYGAIHEFGGKTPPHDIYPTKAKALAFMMGGKQVFAKVVHHPGSTMPERSYMRSGLADMKDEISDRLTAAVKRGINGGR